MSEPLRFDGTGMTCVFVGGDSINVKHCTLDGYVCWSTDPCHCPDKRAAALKAQTPDGTDERGGEGE